MNGSPILLFDRLAERIDARETFPRTKVHTSSNLVSASTQHNNIMTTTREYNPEEDLLNDYDNLPEEVKAALSRFEDREQQDMDGYRNCDQLIAELEPLGYTIDYYLDAEPFDLRKKGECDS